MPSNPTDYSKGLIYKLCCLNTDITDIYIGSTTNLKQRKQGHKIRCNNANSSKYNFNVYKFIRENGGFQNWEVILVEYYPCETKLELERREREIIEELKATLNTFIPTRTKNEYYEDNKERIAQYKKKYSNDNKERIALRDKKYNEKNKEKITERKKEYYEKNKKMIICECGCEITRQSLKRHLTRNIHKTNMEKNNIV